jgi:hypothetical protein
VDAEALLTALEGEALPTALRVNPLREDFKLPWNLEAVPWCPTGYYVPEGLRPGVSPLHDAGAYYLQEASAMAVAEAAGVEKGMKVADLCAAPGGKAGQMGAKLAGTGFLLANEIMPDRARLLSSQLERLGLYQEFDEVIGLDNIHARSKQAQALEWKSRHPEARPLFIGDTEHDAQVAGAVGGDCILFAGGHQSEARLAACGKPTISRVSDILNYL